MYNRNDISVLLLLAIRLTVTFLVMIMLSCCSKPDKIEISRKLATAVSQNDIATVNKLISKGADINSRFSEGSTPLASAASYGFDLIAQILIQRKADLNAACSDGSTPLMLAATKGHTATVALLVDSGADINKIDNSNKTALMLAIDNGYDEIAVNLIDHNAKLDTQNKLDNSTALLQAARKNKTHIIKLLIEKNANAFAVDNNGYDLLMIAAENNNLEAVQMALNRGVIANRVSNDGNTAADLARSNNYIFKLIISKTLETEGWSNYFTERNNMFYLNSSDTVSTGATHKTKIRNYNLETNEYSETSLTLDCRKKTFCYKSFQSKELGKSSTVNDPIIIYERNNCGELNGKMELVSLAANLCKAK